MARPLQHNPQGAVFHLPFQGRRGRGLGREGWGERVKERVTERIIEKEKVRDKEEVRDKDRVMERKKEKEKGERKR